MSDDFDYPRPKPSVNTVELVAPVTNMKTRERTQSLGKQAKRPKFESMPSENGQTHQVHLLTPPMTEPPTSCSPSLGPSLKDGPDNFNLFQALLEYPEIILEMTKHFEVNDLVKLYSISKGFHRVINQRFTSVILAQAAKSASESAQVFSFQCYKSLCIYDPWKRGRENNSSRIRDVPSFRWLRLINHREMVVNEIIKSLAIEGHRLPKLTSKVIKKIWFIMDIPDNQRRIGYVHNPRIWSNNDLWLATMFFMKLDMRFTDPVDGNGEMGLRRLMMAQRSLSVLDRVLKREQLLNSYELLQMNAEWKLLPEAGQPKQSIFGVPWENLGRLSHECWDRRTGITLLRPDQVILRETVARNMDIEDYLLDAMLWGYIDEQTGQDVPAGEPREEENTDDEMELEA